MNWWDDFKLQHLRADRWLRFGKYLVCFGRLPMLKTEHAWGLWISWGPIMTVPLGYEPVRFAWSRWWYFGHGRG